MQIKNTKIILNCLAKDLKNALAIYKISHGDVLIGLLTKDFASDQAYIQEANKWNQALDNHVSIGLGGGDPQQSFMVTRVAQHVASQHINQVFTGVGATAQIKKNPHAIVNALISPTGIKGQVTISTGPHSSQAQLAIIDADTALAMIKDMGGNSVKFFNMQGLMHFEEAQVLIQLCRKYDLTFEPTGGLTIDNAMPIIKACIAQNLKQVIVHIYSSIIDKKTGQTIISEVHRFWDHLKHF